jgi:hypothetical protein
VSSASYVCGLIVAMGGIVGLVGSATTMRYVVGSVPAGGALEVWPWTLVLNNLAGW